MFNWLLNIHKCFGHKRQKSSEAVQGTAAASHITAQEVQLTNLPPVTAGPAEYGIQVCDEQSIGDAKIPSREGKDHMFAEHA